MTERKELRPYAERPDVEKLVEGYRAAADKARRMAAAGRVFKFGYFFLIGALVAYLVACRFGRFPVWPVLPAALMVLAFWFGHRLYLKEEKRALGEALEREMAVRAYADRQPPRARDEILRRAGIPITADELDRIRPSDFE